MSPNSPQFSRFLGRTPSHLYLAPHPLLHGCVAHYTVLFSRAITPPENGAPPGLSIVPDAAGCIVFRLQASAGARSSSELYHGSGKLAAPGTDGISEMDSLAGISAQIQADVWGASTGQVQVQGLADIFPVRVFVEFLPGGLSYFFPGQAQALANKCVPLAQVDAFLSKGFCAAFESILLSGTTDRIGMLSSLCAKLDAILLGRMRFPSSTLLPAFLQRMRGSGYRVKDLSEWSGYSQRHISRVFQEQTGLSAKAFFRVARVNAAVQGLAEGIGSWGDLSEFALDYGFYDQAHLCREFKELCGISPGLYVKNHTGYYHERFKFPSPSL